MNTCLSLFLKVFIGLVIVLSATCAAYGQQQPHGLPPQPALDLPESPDNYMPGVPGVVPPESDDVDDPRDEPAPVFYGEEIDAESASIVYVLDFSDSMNYRNRLAAAKREFKRSLVGEDGRGGLPPSWRFDVILYGCGNRVWKPSLVLATESAKAEAIQWVEWSETIGGTGTGPAVAQGLALDRANLVVVLLTDGDPNCPAPPGPDYMDYHLRMIRAANIQNAAITVFGMGANGTTRQFCTTVATQNGGSYIDVPDEEGTSKGKG